MQLERKNDVAILRMNAGKANAIGPDWLAHMVRLIDDVTARLPGALVITGYENFFSAGLELPALLPLSRETMTGFIDRFDDFMLRLFTLPIPVVAAVNGHAVAGGCVLALQADVRIMTDRECKIGLNEVVLGIGLPRVVVETLRCQVPAASLLPIALEGRLHTPAQALALGLVHEVVPAASLEERAFARASELAAIPRSGFGHVKRSLREPVVAGLRERRAAENAAWLDTWFSPEGQARIRAAVEKLAKKK